MKDVLDAAHLPGKNWRTDNQAEDGILILTELHRLLDRRLAELRESEFWLSDGLRRADYAAFHNKPLAIRSL